jgi:pseudaminic acid synthase
MNKEIMIGNHKISEDSPTFVIAEMSANHLMDFDRAVAIMQAAKDAGADAIKIQTYTPDTITLDCDDPCFQITQGTIWDGTTLHKLYETAYTPWEWQPKLKKIAEEMGLVFFSSPFDLTSIDFLEEMEVPVYKVASFEINDIPFIRKIARTGKPIIMSTGIAYLADIELALRTCKEEGNGNVILLKCTSAYPAPYEDINLKTIPSMKEVFDCVVGLSDHTMGCAVAGAGAGSQGGGETSDTAQSRRRCGCGILHGTGRIQRDGGSHPHDRESSRKGDLRSDTEAEKEQRTFPFPVRGTGYEGRGCVYSGESAVCETFLRTAYQIL